MVFTDIIGEEINARVAVDRRDRGCESIEVRAAKHVGFAYCARRHSDGRNSSIEFRVRGRKEKFFEKATGESQWGRRL